MWTNSREINRKKRSRSRRVASLRFRKKVFTRSSELTSSSPCLTPSHSHLGLLICRLEESLDQAEISIPVAELGILQSEDSTQKEVSATSQQPAEPIDAAGTAEEASMGFFSKLAFLVLICVIIVLFPKIRRSQRSLA